MQKETFMLIKSPDMAMFSEVTHNLFQLLGAGLVYSLLLTNGANAVMTLDVTNTSLDDLREITSTVEGMGMRIEWVTV